MWAIVYTSLGLGFKINDKLIIVRVDQYMDGRYWGGIFADSYILYPWASNAFFQRKFQANAKNFW